MALAGEHVQVLVSGYELTGDSNKVTLSDVCVMQDVTAFADVAHRFIQGQRKIALEHGGYLSAAAAGSHSVLKGATLQGVVSVILGQNTAPVVGDPMHSLYVIQGQYGTMPEIEKYVPFQAQFANSGNQGGWGVALTPPASFTNTTTGNTVDDGAASNNGGAAFLHILQHAASDTYAIMVEHSTDGLVWSALAAFTLNAAALGSERQAIAGAINRYVRFKATRSGSASEAVRVAVSLVRF